MDYGATVYGWDMGLGVFSACMRSSYMKCRRAVLPPQIEFLLVSQKGNFFLMTKICIGLLGPKYIDDGTCSEPLIQLMLLLQNFFSF
jgi:hypothetical protein